MLKQVECSNIVRILRIKVSVYEKVVGWIMNSYDGEAVIVIIIVEDVYKFKQWHISNANYKESWLRLTHTTWVVWEAKPKS